MIPNFTVRQGPSLILKMARLILVAAVTFGALPIALSQASFQSFPNHSQARLLSTHSQLTPGSKFSVALHILLEPEWHTYWKNPGDSGAALWLNIKAPENVHFKEVDWPTPHRISTPPLMTYGYDNQVLFRVSAVLPDDFHEATVPVELEAEWLVCKVECIPAVHTFRVDIPVGTENQHSPYYSLITAPDFQSYPEEEILSGTYQQLGTRVVVNVKELPLNFDFYPESTLKISTARPTKDGSSFVLQAEGDLEGELLAGLLIHEDKGVAYPLKAVPHRPSLIPFILGAFLGGLLLNFMPCVFPIVSLKIFSALRERDSWQKQRQSHLYFVLGVLASFSFIALLLAALKAAGHGLGWGFQLQSPAFVLFLVFLFFILALNFLGVYEISLPGVGSAHLGSGRMSSFMSGALAVVVASPCTAPFMGAALGYALTQSTTSLLVIFFGLGLGFSFPYLVLALFPNLLARLPRSGPWLKTFKEFMFFPMVWTALWLLWIYAQLTSSTSAIWALASLSCLGGLLWWRSGPKGKISKAVGSGAFLILAAFSLGQGLWAHSDSQVTKTESAGSISWSSFDPEELEHLLAQDTSVFIDFTASWCLTCKVNERVTFSQPEVVEFIENENIRMIKADWTKRDPEITRFLERYGRISVPFYLYWSPGSGQPLILPEILTPQVFMNQIKNYQNRQGDSL